MMVAADATDLHSIGGEPQLPPDLELLEPLADCAQTRGSALSSSPLTAHRSSSQHTAHEDVGNAV